MCVYIFLGLVALGGYAHGATCDNQTNTDCDELSDTAVSGANYICGPANLPDADGLVTIYVDSGVADTTCKANVVAATFGYGVLSISDNAFVNSPNLNLALFPSTITIIGAHAFENTALQTIQLPGSITIIGVAAFANCSQLNTIQMNDGVENIEAFAFLNAINVATLYLPASVHTIGEKAFAGTTSLSVFIAENSDLLIGAQAIAGATNLRNLYINPGAIVGSDILLQNPCFATIVPNTLVNIANCVTQTNLGWLSVYNTTDYCNPTTARSIIVPGDIQGQLRGSIVWSAGIIPASAFGSTSCVQSIEHLTLDSGVTTIGDNAFKNAVHINTVRLTTSLTYIGEAAFQGCVALSQITVPGSVTSMSSYAFADCTSLSFVRLEEGVNRIESHAFQGTTAITQLLLPTSMTYIAAYAFEGATNLNTLITFSQSLTVAEYAFDGADFINVYVKTVLSWRPLRYCGNLQYYTNTGVNIQTCYGVADTNWANNKAVEIDNALIDTTTTTTNFLSSTSSSSSTKSTTASTTISTTITTVSTTTATISTTTTTATTTTTTSDTSTVWTTLSVGITTTTTTATASNFSIVDSPVSPSSSASLGLGAIIGLAVGGVIVVTGVVYYCIHSSAKTRYTAYDLL
jgi:hypothetical protein